MRYLRAHYAARKTKYQFMPFPCGCSAKDVPDSYAEGSGVITLRVVALTGIASPDEARYMKEAVVQVYGPRTPVPKKKSTAPRLFGTTDDKDTNRHLGQNGLYQGKTNTGTLKEGQNGDMNIVFDGNDVESFFHFFVDPNGADLSNPIRLKVQENNSLTGDVSVATFTANDLLRQKSSPSAFKVLLVPLEKALPGPQERYPREIVIEYVYYPTPTIPSTIPVNCADMVGKYSHLFFSIVRAELLKTPIETIGSPRVLVNMMDNRDKVINKNIIVDPGNTIKNTCNPLWGGYARVQVSVADIASSGNTTPTFEVMFVDDDENAMLKDLGSFIFQPTSPAGRGIFTMKGRSTVTVVWAFYSVKEKEKISKTPRRSISEGNTDV